MQCIQKCWFAAAKNIIQYFFKIVKWNFLKNYKNRTKQKKISGKMLWKAFVPFGSLLQFLHKSWTFGDVRS